MTNPRSAVNAWVSKTRNLRKAHSIKILTKLLQSLIKRKMNWNMKAPDPPAGGKTPPTGKGKRKLAAINEEPGEEEEAAAPAKRVKSAPKPRKKAPATPKKGKAAADLKSPDVAKGESEEDKADVKAEVKGDVKEENDDGKV